MVDIIYIYDIEFINIYNTDITVTAITYSDNSDKMVNKAYITWKGKFQVPILEYYLLSMIKEEMRYGGQLVEMSRNELDEEIKIPTVYSFLRRFVEYNFLTQENHDGEISKEPKPRGVARRYYSITKTGLEYLALLTNKIKDSLILINKMEVSQ